MYAWDNASFHLDIALIYIGTGYYDFLGRLQDGLKAMVLAYLISSYGIPMLASWIIGKIGRINERLKAIFHLLIF